MESNTQGQGLSNVELNLDEPHFDEAATLLSARPVVPLEVVEAESRSGRRLAIASAIVVALLIGAFGATLVYRLRSNAQQTTIAETHDSNQQTSLALEGGVLGIESQSTTEIMKQQESPVVVNRSQPTSPRLIQREPVVKQKASQPRRTYAMSDDELAEQRELRREIRRSEKREERRLRRVEKQTRVADDLPRIREIFEGQPRP